MGAEPVLSLPAVRPPGVVGVGLDGEVADSEEDEGPGGTPEEVAAAAAMVEEVPTSTKLSLSL